MVRVRDGTKWEDFDNLSVADMNGPNEALGQAVLAALGHSREDPAFRCTQSHRLIPAPRLLAALDLPPGRTSFCGIPFCQVGIEGDAIRARPSNNGTLDASLPAFSADPASAEAIGRALRSAMAASLA